MSDASLLGNVVRGLVALAIMVAITVAASRTCRSRSSWGVVAAGCLLLFAWLMLGVVPRPDESGFLYAIQWGAFGAGLYSAGRMWSLPLVQTAPADPETLLELWFGDDIESAEGVRERSGQWFGGGDDFDALIQDRFGDWPDRARRGDFERWTDSPRGTLALVLALDQLPRNLHRQSGRAFEYDSRACEIALAAIDRGVDQALHPVEAMFLYLPLEHAEDAELQRRCCELFGGLERRCAPGLAEPIGEFGSYAERHRAVIERFGRFPHRNALLGRDSTDEEKAYLADGGETF